MAAPHRRHSFAGRLDRLVRQAAYGSPGRRPAARPLTTEPGPAELLAGRRRLIGFALSLIGPIALAVALIPLRDIMSHTNVALLLVVVVVLAAIVGGRLPAVVAAVTAALAFDFFMTEPYYHVVIDSADDIETTLILGAVGLLVGELVVTSARHRYTAGRRRDELAVLQDVLPVAVGGDREELVATVQQRLTELLNLRQCRWNPDYHGGANALLTRHGTFDNISPGGKLEHAHLPRTVEIPVRGEGRELGRLVLDADPTTPVSTEERLVALAIADLFGAALARHDRTAD